MADNDPARKPFNPQNPDPSSTAGLEPGGGVAPGDTPPAESAVGGEEHEPPQRRRAGGVIVIAVAAIIFLIVALGLIGRAVGLF